MISITNWIFFWNWFCLCSTSSKKWLASDLVSQNKDRALSALEDLDYDHYSIHTCNLSSPENLII